MPEGDDLNLKLLQLKQEIINQSKRVIKKYIPKNDQVRNEIRDNLVKLFNEFTATLSASWYSLDALEKVNYNQIFFACRDKVVRSFEALGVRYKIPNSCFESINPRILDEEFSEDETETKVLDNMPLNAVDFFNLASKLVPSQFDGNPNNLRSFVDSLELLKNNSNDHAANALAFVKTRLTGKARDLITDENTIDAIINTLKNGIKGESSHLLIAKLLNCKQNSKDSASYASEIESLAENLQKAYISEGVPRQIAENYAVENTVRSLSVNANNEKTRLIMQAATFTSVQSVMAKFVNSSTQNAPSNIFYFRQNRPNYSNRSRGRGRGYYQHNNSRGQFSNRGQRSRGNNLYPNHQNFNNRYNNNYRQQNQRSVRVYETTNNSGNPPSPQRVRLGETEMH